MPSNPDWVKKLKPSGPQGSDLLQEERIKSNLDVDKLAEFLFTREVLARQDKILNILQADQVFDKSQNYFNGRSGRIQAAFARAKRLRQLSVKHGWTGEEYVMANDLISEPTPYGLHASMFLLTLKEQGTPEQHKLFLEKAERYEYIVRRQFQDRDAEGPDTGENQVLNYTMVQIRLLPLLAATFALHFTGKGMMALYQENQKHMAGDAGKASDTNRGAGPEELNPGTDLLADLHATSCGLKALASTTAAEGLEICRRACGGHGYSSFSGIGSWYADYLPTTTWEGDNYMLTQQVARYLLKAARSVLQGSTADNDTTRILRHFLHRRDMGAAFDVLNSDTDLVGAFAWRTAFLTFEALKHRDEEKKSWNSLLVDFWRLSTAHSQYLVVKNFHSTLNDPKTAQSLDQETISLLHKLFRLYALNTLEHEASEFFSSAATTVRQIQLARTKTVMKLLEEIRPHAVRLVDAWRFPDWQLDSSLGRYDGKVYEDMFYRASELNPLNKLTFDPYPDSAVLIKKDERESDRDRVGRESKL